MFIIQNGKLTHNGAPFIISSFHNTVEVVGKYPASSVVYCYITGYTEEIKFPLVCQQLTDEGYIFKGQIIINKKIAEYMHKNSDKEFTFKFKFNNEPIEGECKVLINYESIMIFLNTLPDPLTQVMQSVNQLSARLDSYILKKTSAKTLSKVGIKKGMSPIAIDNYGNYAWDYPFAKEKEALKNISQILNSISEQLSTLNSRVELVEKKLTDHIYETYEL